MTPLFLPFVLLSAAMISDVVAIKKPNILFIMADDLGWGNVGYHNTENDEISTPNIDYLVQQGLELNRHYVDAQCSPTRSSFQSGRLPVHVNTRNGFSISDPQTGPHPDMQLIAQKLKAADYSTHMVGKWDAGSATFKHLPISRGYDTSFGYLGKSIDYFTYTSDADCASSYVDLWENDAPAYDAMEATQSSNIYIDDLFAEKVLDKIDEMSKDTEDSPFFIFYASHLPHHPIQLPVDAVANEFYTTFEDDEDQCGGLNSEIYPNWEQDITSYHCRSILQAQVKVLDDIVGQITHKLKETDLWSNTLIIFTSDNGGSLELDYTAGNNYPLRGGKTSTLEGGIRGTAFVSGGYLPDARRGQMEEGMMHIADWYVTFSEMVGVDPHDYDAVDKGLPDVDGYNMWPLISGEVDESPREELVINKNTLFSGDYKLLLGSSNKYAIWQGAYFPNASSPTQSELVDVHLICDATPQWGCLFNVAEDPTEHNNIADDFPQVTEELIARLQELKKDFYESYFEGVDSCPESFSDVESCGCWMSVHNYGGFAGPYQNLEDENIHFIKDDILSLKAKQEIVNRLDDVYIYGGIVAFIVLCLCICGMKRCKNNKHNEMEKRLQTSIQRYGANDFLL